MLVGIFDDEVQRLIENKVFTDSELNAALPTAIQSNNIKMVDQLLADRQVDDKTLSAACHTACSQISSTQDNINQPKKILMLLIKKITPEQQKKFVTNLQSQYGKDTPAKKALADWLDNHTTIAVAVADTTWREGVKEAYKGAADNVSLFRILPKELLSTICTMTVAAALHKTIAKQAEETEQTQPTTLKQ